MIPAWHEGKIGYYSDPGMRNIKSDISDLMPEVNFSLKTFRDTFCQMNIDKNPNNLSAVSVSMGHSTTKTTERHYGRLKQEQALEQLQQVWMPSSV